MRYLGLDLSLTETGWSAIEPDGAITHGVIKTPTALRKVRRLEYVLTNLMNTLEIQNPSETTAAVEGYSMGSRGKVFDIGELGGLVKHRLYTSEVHATLVIPPSSLKMYTTGSGAAKKADMKKKISALLGYPVTNDNEADGVALAMMARAWYQKARLRGQQAKAMKKAVPCYPIGQPHPVR